MNNDDEADPVLGDITPLNTAMWRLDTNPGAPYMIPGGFEANGVFTASWRSPMRYQLNVGDETTFQT